MKVLRYDYRDMFGAACLGLRLRKWLVALPAMLAGVLWWAGLGWAALLVRGLSPSLVWNVYGPVPWPSRVSVGGVAPAVLWGIGATGFTAAWLMACCGVGRITYHQLKGNEFFSLTEAWRFALRKWKAVLLPGLVLVVGAGLLLGLLLLLCVVGRLSLPVAGLLFPLGVLVAFSLLYLAVVFGVGLCMTPAVVAASGSETLETAFELFSIQSGQGKRAWFYSALGTIIAAVYATALGILLGVSTLCASWVMDMGQGGAVGRLLRVSLGWAPRLSSAINGLPGALDSLFLGIGGGVAPAHRAYHMASTGSIVGSIVIAGMLFGFLLLLLAQFTVSFATGQTTAYIVIRQLKDDQNLLEEDLED